MNAPFPPPDDFRATDDRGGVRTPPRGRFPLPRLVRALFETRLDKTANRTRLVALAFTLVFAVIIGRLVMFGLAPDAPEAIRNAASDQVAAARPDILDRNGEVLATDI